MAIYKQTGTKLLPIREKKIDLERTIQRLLEENLSEVFGLVMVLTQCLNGVGDTWIPMITTLLSMWLIQVPLAYFLPNYTGLGVYGVRWAIVTAIALRAIIYTVYFRSGRWKSKKI